MPPPVPPRFSSICFSPSSAAKRDPAVGLGLGLFIASEIAKAHGGTLDVSSNESETRFTFKMHCRATTEAMTGS
jgi:signal transduction histidine kinase